MKRALTIIILTAMTTTVVCAQQLKKVRIGELEQRIETAKGPLIVNFWATFCKPCMEELPHFRKVQAAYRSKGLDVQFVSLDLDDAYPAKVRSFITKRSMATWWLDESNADYFCPRVDSSWSGAIPATLFINNKTGYRKFIEEALSEEALQAEVKVLMKP